MIGKSEIKPEDIEVDAIGRVVLVLHEGNHDRPMSTLEVKRSFIAALEADFPAREVDDFETGVRLLKYTRKLVLK